MSSFYRDKSGRIIVQFFDTETQKTKKLKRSETRIMDSWTDAEIQSWIDKWDAENGRAAYKILRKAMQEGDAPNAHFAEFLRERALLRNLSGSTKSDEKSRFWRHIVPYFVTKHGAKDLLQWDPLVPDFTTHLMTEDKLEINQIKKVLGLLARFGRYLAARRLIPAPWSPLLPTLGRAQPTPLKFTLTPEQVLDFAKNQPPSIALMALLGFFASLSPGETFALEKSDFLTGQAAKSAARTYTRFTKYGLGSGLTVHVSKALKATGTIAEPKTSYRHAYVNVWHPDAAVALAKLLKDCPDGRLFKGTRTKLFAAWAIDGEKLGATLHDLRRASALYLGRTKLVELLLLQDHMRHGDVKMTMVYTRNPAQGEEVAVTPDWDDVG